jgi:glycosyltransferase involved in cell wall biosynthesis
MRRVVSLTPASLDRDSRTLKQATTVARLGYASTVVEAQRSAREVPAAPFDVVTLRSVGDALADAGGGIDGEGDGAAVAGRGWVERIAALLGRVAGPLYFLASWAAFNVATARRLPAADLYYLHGYEQALAVWLRRAPYVYDAHDLYVALPHDGRALSRQERAVHWVRERIERRCIRKAAARVTTSEAMARAYRERFGASFDVVRNAQDARLARPSARDVRSAAGVGDDAFLLVMVAQRKPGTIVPSSLPEGVHLAFVGDGYEADAAAAPERVHFVGSAPPDEIASFLRSADAAALLYVPVTANSPTQLVNGLFHAVAAGLPLLVPDRMDAIRSLCERHGLGVVVDPEDPASLAAGIAELRGRLDELRAAVRAAAPELSWEHEERELARILERALAG